MEIQIKRHLVDLENDKAVIDRLIEENMNGKLDQYLQQFASPDAEGSIELTLERNKKGLFNGTLQASLDGAPYRYEREDYQKLDDLVNHLFAHFKEGLSAK